jgi:hypothetical protein
MCITGAEATSAAVKGVVGQRVSTMGVGWGECSVVNLDGSQSKAKAMRTVLRALVGAQSRDS